MVIAQSNTTFTADAAIVIQGANNIQTLAIAERNLIEGTDNPDIIFGTQGNDEIRAKGGDDILLGTTGDDLLDGGAGFDTVDYSNLGQAITLFPRGAIALWALRSAQSAKETQVEVNSKALRELLRLLVNQMRLMLPIVQEEHPWMSTWEQINSL
ncbi:hypothetical protein [Scytonema sp. PCC 10023]|uniref:calcium-binding protein n=1 Tax=Scytonema sp. PCC 10023 TaxID=1680591 RepID=UPI0039C6E78B